MPAQPLLHHGLPPHYTVSCQNCEWTGKPPELNEIEDFASRVYPGEPCPAGECPKCGALCHLNNEFITA